MSNKTPTKCSICNQDGTLRNVYNIYDDTYHYNVCNDCVDIIKAYNEQNAFYAWNIYTNIT